MSRHMEMLNEIDEQGEGLTEFELNFVESMKKAIAAEDRSFAFTDKQRDLIARIHEERVPQ